MHNMTPTGKWKTYAYVKACATWTCLSAVLYRVLVPYEIIWIMKFILTTMWTGEKNVVQEYQDWYIKEDWNGKYY